jgi:hypothetical protein
VGRAAEIEMEHETSPPSVAGRQEEALIRREVLLIGGGLIAGVLGCGHMLGSPRYTPPPAAMLKRFSHSQTVAGVLKHFPRAAMVDEQLPEAQLPYEFGGPKGGSDSRSVTWRAARANAKDTIAGATRRGVVKWRTIAFTANRPAQLLLASRYGTARIALKGDAGSPNAPAPRAVRPQRPHRLRHRGTGHAGRASHY